MNSDRLWAYVIIFGPFIAAYIHSIIDEKKESKR